MPKTKCLRDVGVVRHGEDTARSSDVAIANNHSTIMEWRVFEKDIFDESLADFAIDDFPSVNIFRKVDTSFHYDECAHLLFAHAHASHDERQDLFAVHRAVVVVSPEPAQDQ